MSQHAKLSKGKEKTKEVEDAEPVVAQPKPNLVYYGEPQYMLLDPFEDQEPPRQSQQTDMDGSNTDLVAEASVAKPKKSSIPQAPIMRYEWVTVMYPTSWIL